VIRYLLLAILILMIARAFWRVVDGILEAAGGTTRQQQRRRSVPATKLVRDPVCGTWVPERSPNFLTSGGTTHYFCSDKCREAFSRK
jgi:YHS domain-containing protein